MKKSISLILVALVLAGCSFFQKKERHNHSSSKRRYSKHNNNETKQRQVLLKLQRLSLLQLLKRNTQTAPVPKNRLY